MSGIGLYELRRRGWERVDGGKCKTCAFYRGPNGWTLEHCGHPTAHYSYILKDAKGRMVLTGANVGPRWNPYFGVCWSTVDLASIYVAGVEAGNLPRPWSNGGDEERYRDQVADFLASEQKRKEDARRARRQRRAS